MAANAYKQLVDIAEELKSDYADQVATWENSPFQWIKGGISSRQKGQIGEIIVNRFLTLKGFTVGKSPDSDADLIVNDKRVEVKLSTLWSGGIYKFQQIRDQSYDLLFCLGLSPSDAHAWVAQKSDIIWTEMAHQHGGARGSDTWWISFEPPNSPHSWMRPQNGDLSHICESLRDCISRKRS